MRCPLCNQQLAKRSGVFVCPKGHGTLVTGRYLSDIEQAANWPENADKVSSDTKQALTCPHCSHTMYKVNYNGTGIIIDACAHCHYRWLDAGEITKIKSFKPNMIAADLLFVAELDHQMRKEAGRKVGEANPRLPLQGSYRFGAEALGDSRARLGAIAGQGLYGIVRGLKESKASRIITLTVLVIFAVLFYLIFIDAKHAFDT
jgi:Zn-finger nucleic acid-binding protein